MRRDPLAGLVCADTHQRATTLQFLFELLESSNPGVEELRAREGPLFEALVECAALEGSAVAAGRCLFLYGQHFSAFSSVWRWILAHISAALPFQRLRAHVRVVHSVIEAGPGAEALEGHTTHILNALLKVLESTRRVELLPEIVPIFSSVSIKAPLEFSASFQDSVDLLLGWAVDVALPDCACG